MKVKVMTEFRDKYTEEVYSVGTILEMSEKRAEEINNTRKGLIQILPEPAEPAEPVKRSRRRKVKDNG